MHHEAEEGVAAHWAYSEKKATVSTGEGLKKAGVFAPSKKLSWVKQLVDWQKEMADSDEFVRAVKFDALRHRNFIFSPLGDVYDLPVGATPVDFAYAVHTEVGHNTVGAKVDGKMVPLDFKLRSGQVVEIIKSKNPKGPNNDWLQSVVTTLARREIAKYFRKAA
jgi:GTP pyrophosphokinase